ncbi:MAG: restriction endonuclease subunit S, partial [Betaproteobacteria bacterium]
MKAGWHRVKLGDICGFDKAQAIHKGLPYVGLENIESNTGTYIGALEPQSVRSSTFRFSPRHVLYGRLRPYLNKVLLPDFDGHCSTEIFPILPSKSVSREFLFYWLTSDTTVQAINGTATGARMPRANMNAVLEFALAVPSLGDQQRIVAILDEAFDGIATAKANAEK